MTARRATIFQTADGSWRFKVQGTNWRTIDSSAIGAKRSTVEKIVARRWPGVEIVVKPL